MAAETAGQRRLLRIALALNASMFVAEVAAGIIAHSSGLIADGLDMLADAIAYAIALAAISRTALFKAKTARTSGMILFGLGLIVLGDVIRRLFVNESPEGLIMIVIALSAAAVNTGVLVALSRQRQEVHIRAASIFTKVDVIANLAVALTGAIVLWTGWRGIDLIVGAAIGAYVIKEAIEILDSAGKARRLA